MTQQHPPAGSNRILLAEDHYVSRHLLQRQLSHWGFQVAAVEEGESALRLLESPDAPSLALIDWMMPGLDGLEICRRIRAIGGNHYIYVILLTSKNEKQVIETALGAGVDDYMIKPFDPDELRSRLKIGQRVAELEQRLARCKSDIKETSNSAKRLTRLVPVCSSCKTIRDDQDYWREVEQYLRQNAGTDFTHGVCPACAARL